MLRLAVVLVTCTVYTAAVADDVSNPLSAATLHAACKQKLGLYSLEQSLTTGYHFVAPPIDGNVDLERCVTIGRGSESGSQACSCRSSKHFCLYLYIRLLLVRTPVAWSLPSSCNVSTAISLPGGSCAASRWIQPDPLGFVSRPCTYVEPCCPTCNTSSICFDCERVQRAPFKARVRLERGLARRTCADMSIDQSICGLRSRLYFLSLTLPKKEKRRDERPESSHHQHVRPTGEKD